MAVASAPVDLEPHAQRFAPPPAPERLVARPALVGRLRDAAVPVVVLCAPAGYGKTALLAEWASSDPRPVAWITIAPEHRDAGELLADLLGALDQLGPAAEAGGRPGARGARRSPLGRVRDALAAVRAPGVLVVDDAHLLASEQDLDAVRMICSGLPPGSQVALGCRAEPALRLGLLRSRGLLLRLGAADLAMGPAEAARLLEEASLNLAAGQAEALVERTEGWPAALRLAGLGDDGAIEDYLEDEVLAELTAEQLDLLTGGSVLERLSAASCDAVLGRLGSGPLLAEIARADGLIVHDGGPPGSYRLHRLVAEALRARLERRQPELVAALNGRASAHFERGGDAKRAIRHASAAGDARRAGNLARDALPGRLATGRLDEVGRWLAPFAPGEIGATPGLALAAAWCGMEGGGRAVEHWVEVAGRTDEPAVAVLRAASASDGAARMLEDAAAGCSRLAHDSPWRAVSCALEGVARDLLGDRDTAVEHLREGARRSGPELPWVELLCRAWLCLIAQREGAWERAASISAQAEAALAHEGLADYATAALAHSGAAVLLARGGRGDESRRRRARARSMLALVPDVAPWRLVASRLLLARASILMGDAPTARLLLDEAREPHSRIADSPVLRDELDAARAAVEGIEAGARRRHVPLTAAEARVLRFLPTHHSFRDIGQQLHISRFTVKSQALAIYRKLNVSSRGEAVARAQALGLV